ncbi:DNA gyrase inhibitor YacG [Iodidimonas sp. SYSU 1G8]|uniref:DNA gyrase inhibitor YacG n=1 Tax=Iodidimonas sp. SYSU 1G8 TaxID=3133967 RepID=UPI0031FEF8C3
MNDMSQPPTPPGPARACPICRKPAVERYMPFCSKRCGDIDLGRWLDGRYVIEGDDSMSEGDEEN